jgi:hypothetical protein
MAAIREALLRMAVFLRLQLSDICFPNADNKGPAEGRRQKSEQSAQAFRVLNVRVSEESHQSMTGPQAPNERRPNIPTARGLRRL